MCYTTNRPSGIALNRFSTTIGTRPLANDILRLWRTFCVNYEARTSSEPADKKAKRKLKNYKLKHSRLLTCYSGLLYLLDAFEKAKTVSPDKAVEMVKLSPIDRLLAIRSKSPTITTKEKIDDLLALYETFLKETDEPEAALLERFMNKDKSVAYYKAALKFGDAVYAALQEIGGASPLHRLLVV